MYFVFLCAMYGQFIPRRKIAKQFILISIQIGTQFGENLDYIRV